MASNNGLYQKYVMTKYKGIVLQILGGKRFISTNGVVRKIKKETGKTVNWYLIYHVLQELEKESKVEKIESETGFMWKLRKNGNDHQP